jgi:hypothetical protein
MIEESRRSVPREKVRRRFALRVGNIHEQGH